MRMFSYLAAALLAACNLGETSTPNGPGNQTPTTGQYDKLKLLAALAEHVIVPIYQNAATVAADLESAAAAHALAVGNGAPATGPTLAAAQTAWKTAMNAWQYAEVLQIGPAAPIDVDAGGEGLRDEIYSWPAVNTCRVDQEIVAGAYSSPSFFSDKLVNVYGFDALEYLLFYTASDNTCAPQATINSGGAWDALGPVELGKRRADYAAAVAKDIAAKTEALLKRWQADGGNFAAKLAAGGSPYADAAAAMNAVFRGLFYIEINVKDDKIAYPAGLRAGCDAACPSEVESPWANVSKENVLANLAAFELAFYGGDGAGGNYGFDDALKAVGAADLATSMASNLSTAIAAIEAVDGTFQAVLTANEAGLDAAHAALKKLTDQIKSDMVTALTLQIPSEGAGDTD